MMQGWSKTKDTQPPTRIKSHQLKFTQKIRRQQRDLQTRKFREQVIQPNFPQYKLISLFYKLKHSIPSESNNPYIPQILTFIEQSVKKYPQVTLELEMFTKFIDVILEEIDVVGDILIETLEYWFDKAPIDEKIWTYDIKQLFLLGSDNISKQIKTLKIIIILLSQSKQLCEYYYERNLQLITLQILLESNNSQITYNVLKIIFITQNNTKHSGRKLAFLSTLPLLVRAISLSNEDSKIQATKIISNGIRSKHITTSELTKKTSIAEHLMNNLSTTSEELKLLTLSLIGIIVSLSENSEQFLENNLLDHLTKLLDHPDTQIFKVVLWIISNLTREGDIQYHPILEHQIFHKLISKKTRPGSDKQTLKCTQYEICRLVENVIVCYDKDKVWGFVVKHDLLTRFFGDFNVNQMYLEIYCHVLGYLLDIIGQQEEDVRQHVVEVLVKIGIFEILTKILEQENRFNAHGESLLLSMEEFFKKAEKWPM